MKLLLSSFHLKGNTKGYLSQNQTLEAPEWYSMINSTT